MKNALAQDTAHLLAPIREEADLRGRRLVLTSSLVPLAPTAFPGVEIVERRSPAETLEPLCQGAVEAALMEEMYARGVLLSLPAACRGFDLRAVDLTAHVDYVLIARRDGARAARALRSALDDITVDGTLAAIAARYPAISTLHARRLAAAIQIRYEKRMFAIGIAAAGVLLLLGFVVTVALSRSRLRLRAANEQLRVDLEARVKAEAALRNSEARFRALFDSAPQSIFALDHGGTIVFANRKAGEMFGYETGELIGKSLEILLPERLRAEFRENRLARRPEAFGLRAGGGEFPIEISLGSVETSEGLTLAFLGDISDRAGDRAAALTRQLLMFSRRQAGAPRVISLLALVGNIEKLLRRLIGEDIEMLFVLDPGTAAINADPVHIEQIVVNLAINARDAMPEGGRLVIETAAFRADAAYAARHAGVEPGDYAVLKVSDTGCGMTPEVKARVFEPFFTTKEQGKGTGLGAARPLSGSETILVAEDEPGVRKFIRDLLSSEGYRILEADNGRTALETAAAEVGPIHLLVTDLVMPELGGAELVRRFAELYPAVPVLLMSGYADRAIRPGLPGISIEKPFTPDVLLRVVRETLDKRFASPVPAG